MLQDQSINTLLKYTYRLADLLYSLSSLQGHLLSNEINNSTQLTTASTVIISFILIIWYTVIHEPKSNADRAIKNGI